MGEPDSSYDGMMGRPQVFMQAAIATIHEMVRARMERPWCVAGTMWSEARSPQVLYSESQGHESHYHEVQLMTIIHPRPSFIPTPAP
jgi:hypothetical protein